MGHFRKTSIHAHGGNWKWTTLPLSDVIIHLLLSQTIFSLLPLRTADISSVEGVWIFSITRCGLLKVTITYMWLIKGENRVSGSHFSDQQIGGGVLKLENAKCVPSSCDNAKQRDNYIVLVRRVIATNIKCLLKFPSRCNYATYSSPL
jgi:hypothetical protein